MKAEEVGRRYQIPLELLREDQDWGFISRTGEYEEADLSRLSLMLTLQEIGFAPAEIREYLHLWLDGEKSSARRIQLLEEKRAKILETIHAGEQKLERLDCLRYHLRKQMVSAESAGKTGRRG